MDCATSRAADRLAALALAPRLALPDRTCLFRAGDGHRIAKRRQGRQALSAEHRCTACRCANRHRRVPTPGSRPSRTRASKPSSEKFTPDELETALAGLPDALAEPDGEIIDGMVMWTGAFRHFRCRSRRAAASAGAAFRRKLGDQLMQIWNQMGYPHEFTMGMDKAGHEYIVVVVKGTFDFPEDTRRTGAKIGENRFRWSSPTHRPASRAIRRRYGRRISPSASRAAMWWPMAALTRLAADRRSGCRSASRWATGRRLFEVVGHREWRAIGPVFTSTSPQPFLKMPITYDNAWGGVDRLNPEDKLPGAYLRNPVGTGWAQTKNQRFIPGLRLPNTQAIGEEIRSPFGDYKPMSLGRWAAAGRAASNMAAPMTRTGSTTSSRSCRRISTSAISRWRRPTSRSTCREAAKRCNWST